MKITDLQGTDANLQASLMEYGFLIGKNENCADGEWFVVFRVNGTNEFDKSYLTEKFIADLMYGKEWMNEKDINNVLAYGGYPSLNWFQEEAFLNQLSTLLSFYGFQNVLGTTYETVGMDVVNGWLGTEFETY